MCKTAYSLIKYSILVTVICLTAILQGFAQDLLQQEESQAKRDIEVFESRFSTTTPVVGDRFTYFFKFDHIRELQVHPVEQLSEQGFSILEEQHLAPQEFDGRVIEQYEYTLQATQAGDYQFSPASIHFNGPHKNPIAAVSEPEQITVSSIVDVQVVSNSPLMLGEALEIQLHVTKRKPVTMSAMPQTLRAEVQIPEQAKAPEINQATGEPDVTSTPTPQPAVLECVLDQSQNIVPQQVDGQTIEEYQYLVTVQPEVAGEYVLPEFRVSYRTGSGEEVEQIVEQSQIFVLNPNTGNLDIATDYRFLIAPIIVAAAVLVGGLLVFLYLKYRHPREAVDTFVLPPLPPGDVAHQELAEIQAMELPSKGEFKEYYTLVSESVRKFLGAEYHFHVLERTTEEILTDIKIRDIPDKIKRRVSTFLPEADMVKFAKYTPNLEQTDQAMEDALHIVDESLEYHQITVSSEDAGSDSQQAKAPMGATDTIEREAISDED